MENNSDKQIKEQTKRKAPKTAFKPGQSGNPKGRPKKGNAIADILNDLTEGGDRKVIMQNVIKLAKQGVPWAVHFYADRTEGKAVETVRKQKIDAEIEIL